VTDNQHSVEVDVYQGEDEDVRRNHRIGKFLIEGLAKVPAGNQLVVQLDLTLDGILKVSAKEKVSGLKKQITIDNVLARFTLAERDSAQARIDRMWNAFETGDIPEPKEAAEGAEQTSTGVSLPPAESGPREGQRETVQARAILEKAERLREAAADEDKAELDRLMGQVREAIESRNWAGLQTASNELSDVLFYLEDA